MNTVPPLATGKLFLGIEGIIQEFGQMFTHQFPTAMGALAIGGGDFAANAKEPALYGLGAIVGMQSLMNDEEDILGSILSIGEVDPEALKRKPDKVKVGIVDGEQIGRGSRLGIVMRDGCGEWMLMNETSAHVCIIGMMMSILQKIADILNGGAQYCVRGMFHADGGFGNAWLWGGYCAEPPATVQHPPHRCNKGPFIVAADSTLQQ